MKPVQHRKGAAEKKHTDLPLMGASSSTPTAGETAQPKPSFGSPSAAVWGRYIDSRMKQFGTR